jgi:ribosomal 50S subunit-associated protein YjgA (DUF615 family)
VGKKKAKFQWTRDENNPEGVVHLKERQTWSDQDQSNKRIVALALALSKLKSEKLETLTLEDDLRETIEEAFRLRSKGVRGGMRRHMLLLASMIRGQDTEHLELLFEETSALLDYKF